MKRRTFLSVLTTTAANAAANRRSKKPLSALGIQESVSQPLQFVPAKPLGHPHPVTFVPFRHMVIDPNYAGGGYVGAADFNSDQYTDVVAASSYELAWYEYPTWGKHAIAYPDQQFTMGMAVADVNGDGAQDIIISDGKNGKLYWFENPCYGRNAATGLWRQHLIGVQGGSVHDLVVGDIRGNGKVDIVTRSGNHLEPGCTILWMQSDPDSWVRVELPTIVQGEGTALGDINRDGRLDVVQNGYWLECPPDPVHGRWVCHYIDRNWSPMAGVCVADMNHDGRLDVVLSPAEGKGVLAWYEAPPDPIRGKWIKHVVDPDVQFINTLKVTDINNDGYLDIVAAEMAAHGDDRDAASHGRVRVYLNQGDSLHWTQQVLATTGGSNLCVANINNDGTVSVISASGASETIDHHPLEIWINGLNANRNLPLDRWTCITVDDKRAKWGDFSPPSYLRYFGIASGDFTGNGLKDIVSGRYFYRNPGGDMTAPWERIDFGLNVDAMLVLDVDDDGQLDVIAEALPDVYWLKPMDRQCNSWKAMKVVTIPTASHRNSQGYRLAQLLPGRKPQLILACKGIYYITIPDNPTQGNWPATRACADATDEGFAVADIDGDGKLDIAASYTWKNVPMRGRLMAWWENPGKGSADWKKHPFGTVKHWKDRCDAADLTGNGRPDIIATGESSWGPTSVYWFENPGGRSATSWKRHILVTQHTTNSLGVADMNRDGWPDIVVAEHRGTKILSIWENKDRGRDFVEYIVSTGRENHLGCHLDDLDGDGDTDIAGIAWDDYRYLYVWRNDAKFVLGNARTVTTPVIEPDGGNSTGMFTVHLTTSTPDAVIRYTVDGTDPSLTSGSLYAQPLQIAGSCTVKARAFKVGFSDSVIATAVFKTTYLY